jgi:SAM-dependent methyltransferase
MTTGTEVERFYDAFAGTTLLLDFRRINERQRAVQALCDRFVPDGARVLEIGCGAGIISRHVARRARRLLAVDISGNNVELAKRFAGGPGREFKVLDVLADGDKLRDEEPFDAVLLADVIEHIPLDRHAELLALIESVLAPGGRLLLAFPSAAYQEHLKRHRPEALQVVDETVEVRALLGKTRLQPLHVAHVDVWGANQYVHVVLAAGIGFGPALRRGLGYRVRRLFANLVWRARNAAFVREARRLCERERK